MRLALKIFVAQSLVILVVAAVAYYSISEIASLLPASRATTIRTAEALRVEVLLRESMRQASALEQRFLVFGDQEYASEPTRMAQEMADALAALRARLATELERARLRSAIQHFTEYREATAAGRRLRAAGDARQAGEVIDRYRQAHGGRGGTGLGLAIVRAMAEAHGGRVDVESREDHGSRFTISLPRRLATPPGTPA